ncbi:hypothetical protein [Bifidobacterium pseudolongum]|uniref:hypothetical protein n=1 Tax=Bifidobacterium pseudolongum TaxID=1694 RepID=UPI0010E7AC43|nr:hypothetical protein [Bifidobacterium pseudolongum]RYQ34015.1 hypothetical protein PG2004B_0878 [Bifidobacterium pseudolongum subsp. globosum]
MARKTTADSEPETVEETPAGRIEVFDVDCPDGVRRRVTRNIDTGEQTVEPVGE